MPQPATATRHSRFLRQLLQVRPELADATAGDGDLPLTTTEVLSWLDVAALNEENLKVALRRMKQRGFVRVCHGDVAGRASLAAVTESMTVMAEAAVTAAVSVLSRSLVARYGQPRNAAGEVQELIVIGMGKLGGRELNVSSDIDLIFVYPDDGDTDGEHPTSNFEFFTRLGRQVIAAIADLTDDGQVFRVDMRLRPNGDSGPLVCSFDMLENYFFTQGREWERYAWIKARPLCGARLDELEAIRIPFVFRRYLDFGAIKAMRELHVQIRREVAKKDMADNIKLGPGGIREIEFIAQVFQLIRGGRDRLLQVRPTLHVLNLLVERGQLSLDTTAELAAAYDFLRRLEHRLQYLDNAQTHRLPQSTEDQLAVADMMGFGSYDALLVELDDHRQTVARHFEAVFADPNDGRHALDNVWHDAGGQGDEFSRLGFSDADAARDRLAAIRSGSRYQQLSEVSKGQFDALVPRLIEAAAATSHPDATLSRGLDLLETISRRAVYLSLMLQYPQALTKVAQMVGSSVWAAGYLNRHPILLDELLAPSLLEPAPDWPAFRQQLQATLDDVAPDTERQMDLMREAHHAQVFRLLAQDLAGLLSVERLSDHLSDLADQIVAEALRQAWLKLPSRHRDEPRFAVIAYGKLGGKELGYASDLDLVFIFDDDDADAARVYSRLGMRLNTWLSAQTAAGQLFETDLRLRPNGDSGLIVSSLHAFRQYQLESAWLWEHQALTRARFCAGDAEVGRSFEAIRNEILCLPRDPAHLRSEVIAMRQRMFENHGGKSDLFDLKQDRGGLIDVEFVVQTLVLGHAREYPELTANRGNIALLAMAAERDLIPADLAEAVRNAYRDYRRMQHALRLDNRKSRVAPAAVAERAAAVRQLWQLVLGEP
jgi:glutamate-ammonia-ligase adenylyltransferase